VLCGIPRSADIGTSTTFSVSATNSNGTTTQAVTLTVSAVVVPPPGITSGAPPVAVTDLTYCHAFSTSQIIPSGGWSISAGAPPQWATLNTKRGVICGIPRISDIGTSASFNVSATNANGTTTQAVTLTVTSVALPTPIITSVVPTSALVGATVTINGTGLTSVTSVKIGSADASFTSNGTGTAITTTVPALAIVGLGNVVLGTAVSASAATSSFAVLAPGTGEFSIEGIPLPSISKFPTVTPSHAGLNGAGPYVNAYAMEPTRCITSPTLTRSWQHNIDLADYRNRTASDLFTLTGSEALTYKVTIPTGDTQGGVTFQENTAAGAGTAPAFISISATPCDFDVTKIAYNAASPTRQCYQTAGNGVTISWTNYSQPTNISLCNLTKGQTYYVNIRFVDGVNQSANSCPVGTNGYCGGGLTFN
jgi:hypothetical protein